MAIYIVTHACSTLIPPFKASVRTKIPAFVPPAYNSQQAVNYIYCIFGACITISTVTLFLCQGVSACVVSEAPPFIPSILPSLTRERADPSAHWMPSPSLTPSSPGGTVSETQVTWDMDDFLCSAQSDHQNIGETSDGLKPPALCTSKSCKNPVYHEK